MSKRFLPTDKTSAPVILATVLLLSLLACIFASHDAFAKDSRATSSSSSQSSASNREETTELEETAEAPAKEPRRDERAYQRQQSGRAWDDSMIAAPAFGD